MPGERIPQDKLPRSDSRFEQAAPDNRCGGFGKKVTIFVRPARSVRMNGGEKSAGSAHDLRILAEENSLRGHGDAAEVSAPIPKRFADEKEPRLAEAVVQVSMQLCAPDTRGYEPNIVPQVRFPPGVEDGARGRVFQESDKDGK